MSEELTYIPPPQQSNPGAKMSWHGLLLDTLVQFQRSEYNPSENYPLCLSIEKINFEINLFVNEIKNNNLKTK